MQQTLRNETTTAIEPQSKREHCEDGPVLDDEAALAHLETDIELDPGGDPVKGIAIGLLIGAAMWTALAVVLVQFW